MTTLAAEPAATAAPVRAGSLQRRIGWTGAFWIASGVPALVLFSVGAIAATVGKPAWLVWVLSIAIGFLQAFTYAEIAGLFPNKAGGVSIHGAVAWARYGKLIAPLSVWCNWLAWAPVLAIGSGLAAGYILGALFPADAAINTWQLTLLDLGRVKSGLALRIDATFFVGVTLLVTVFAIQYGGIVRSARTTLVLGVTALVPLMLIALVPLLTGDLPAAHFRPLAPLAYDGRGMAVDGDWSMAGITLMAGGLFIAAWSTYGFETAACYTREFRHPKTDTPKAIFGSGLLCIAFFSLVPLAFQGHLGLGAAATPAALDAAGNVVAPAVHGGMLAPDVYSGTGVAKVMAGMAGGGAVVGNLVVVMLILAILLSIMTTMSGAARTLYQAAAEGWLPRYLAQVNEHGAPTRAMWTNLGFNVVLLMMSDYVFVLACSNVGYILFNFLTLQSGWIHRLDRPDWARPYRAPTLLLGIGALLGFVNLALMGLGANIHGAGTLMAGLAFAALIVPVFVYRHYVQDRGRLPGAADDALLVRRGGAGAWPYLALTAGVGVVYVAHRLAVY